MKNLVDTFGLVQYVKDPTRNNNILDLLFCSSVNHKTKETLQSNPIVHPMLLALSLLSQELVITMTSLQVSNLKSTDLKYVHQGKIFL